jgi:hypothetical protein
MGPFVFLAERVEDENPVRAEQRRSRLRRREAAIPPNSTDRVELLFVFR